MEDTHDIDLSTPSTAEAISLASASVLGSTTRRGHPIGTAIGSGSMMESNSEEVALNVMPVVFSARDSLLHAEHLELLAAEWYLEGSAGSELLPEELVIAGSSFGGINTHVCVLSWEKGVVDPFKIDSHITNLSKKIGDIEQAIEANELDYERDGLLVLRRFSDRFNRVLFVDMMDRRFKGSWDSVQIKHEGSEAYLRVRSGFSEDFTSMPPSIRVLERQDIEFLASGIPWNRDAGSLSRMISTPLGIDTVTRRLPELGRSILREMNAYAYSAEELDIARSLVESLIVRVGKERVMYSDFENVLEVARQMIEDSSVILSLVTKSLEEHIQSGKVLTVPQHIDSVGEALDELAEGAGDGEVIKSLLEQLEKSLLRTFPKENEVRAWQMRSSIRYFLTYYRRVNSYFIRDLKRYLVIGAVTEAFMLALEGFRDDLGVQDYDNVDSLLFTKFFVELVSQLRAVFDREAFESGKTSGYSELAESLGHRLMDAFEQIEIWSLVSFGDLAEIVRTQIVSEYSDSGSEDTLDEEGKRLIQRLNALELVISETLPDFVDHVSSAPFMSEFLMRGLKSDRPGKDRLIEILRGAKSKPDEWIQEAAGWVDAFAPDTPYNSDTELLADFLTFVHKRYGAGISAASMVERVAGEEKTLEEDFQQQLQSWQDECERIEAENAPVIARNKKRLELIAQARSNFENEQAEYEEALEEYEQHKRMDYDGVSDSPKHPVTPEPLDLRIARIEREYPEGIPKPIPEKPLPSEALIDCRRLRALLSDRLERMDERLHAMSTIFSKRLEQLKSEGTRRVENIKLSISDGFLDHLLDSMIRSLGKLMPRIQRVLLRDLDDSSRIHVVSYDYVEDEFIVTIGYKEVA